MNKTGITSKAQSLQALALLFCYMFQVNMTFFSQLYTKISHDINQKIQNVLKKVSVSAWS